MNHISLSWLDAAFRAVVHATWQGAVLAVVVLALTRCLGERLRANWRFTLWLVVLARLATPWVPAAPWSVYALLPDFEQQNSEMAAVTVEAVEGVPDRQMPLPPARQSNSLVAGGHELVAGSQTDIQAARLLDRSPATDRSSWIARLSVSQWLIIGWLAGMALPAARIVRLHLRLVRCRALWRRPVDPVLHALLDQCRATAGVGRPVNLLLASGDVGPATCGVLVPTIVLPERLAALLQHDELRLVLLHELIHVRRGDALVDFVSRGIACIHWFNPAAWLALASLRHERELACDAALLELLGSTARKDYGSVLLKAVETLDARGAPAGAVAMFERHFFSDPLAGRIHMIANYRRMTTTARAAGGLLAISFAAIGLTDAGTQTVRKQAAESAVNAIATESPADKSEQLETAVEPPATAEPPSTAEPSPANPASSLAVVDKAPPANVASSPRTQQAIREGAAFLSGEQQDNGAWGKPGGGNQCGVTSLCTLALLRSGVQANDLRIRRAAEFLGTQQPTGTYEAGLQAVALCTLDPKRHAGLIERNVKWLEGCQVREGQNQGSWSYGVQNDAAGRGDLSCSGFAIWGLDAAAQAGAKVRDETWEQALAYYIKAQTRDGGWGYTVGAPFTSGSMTASGLASVALCLAHVRGGARQPTDAEKQVLERGRSWLAANFAADRNPPDQKGYVLYYQLMVRRAGEALQTESFGAHEWRRELTEHLLKQQDAKTGAWTSVPRGEPILDTAFVVLTIGESGTRAPD